MSEPRFRFGPLERRGVLLGLSLGQLVAMATGAAVAVLVTSMSASVLGVVVAIVAVVAGCSVALAPVAGQPAVAWLPTIASTAATLLSRGRLHLSDAPTRGRTPACPLLALADPPPPLHGCRIIEARAADGPLGVIHDRRAGTYTAVLRVRGTGFALLDDHERDRRLAWWGSFLEWLCSDTSHVHRLQWCERGLPSLADHAPRSTEGDAVAGSYRDLLDDALPSTQRHECLIAVTLSASRSARALRSTRLPDRAAAACAVLERQLRPLIGRLRSGDVDLIDVLDERGLAAAVRAAAAPQSEAATRDDIAPGLAWPLSTLTSWSRYRTDATEHATYWIAEWPRTDVGPDFLAPLLLQTAARRTVAVTMGFESPLRAEREAEAALTADVADEDVRRRAGFLIGFRRRREQESTVRRGEEVAAGHGSVRFSGYVTVTVGHGEDLDAACAEVEQQAHQSRLVLRRLHGQQDVAFTYTMPLGRGLR